MFCSLSTIVSSRSRLLSFEEKHIRKIPCIPAIVLKTFILYLTNYRNILSQRNLFIQNHDICITIAYTTIRSNHSMLLEHFTLPSLLLLHKISSGTTDAVKCAQTLRNEGKIYNDVCLMFDEM